MDTSNTSIIAAAVTEPEAANYVSHARPIDFMERVVEWPEDNAPGYINMHWQAPPDKGTGMRGRPFTSLHEFMDFAQYAATKPGTYKEIFFCLSMQSKTGKVVHNRPTAHRHADTAVALKALWIDVDVKPDQPDKAYGTLGEAMDAIKQFVDDAALPPPSAFVFSGGGVHVYWFSNSKLTLAQWKPYAEGPKAEALRLALKCDAGVTADAARVLRVPGTFNNKIKGLPRPVKLMHLGPGFDFATEPTIAGLPAKAPVRAVTAAATKAAAPVFVLPPAFTGGMHPALAAVLDPVNDVLGSGISKGRSDLPLDPKELFIGCQHFRDSFATHGANHSQGLWMLTGLASTSLDKGRAIFHSLSEGYPTYSPGETDKMFDRKLIEKAERDLGWPSCSAFEGEGAKCKTCPFYGKLRSPLNLCERVAAPMNGTNNTTFQANLAVAGIRGLRQAGGSTDALFAEFNKGYAAVKHGGEVLVAGHDVALMKVEDFHKMFANVRVAEDNRSVEVSRLWWRWPDRRQYFGRGIVFDPGGPLEVPDDALNLWRGFGIEPKQGAWSLLHGHIFQVVCSGNQEHFDYLIRWMAYAVQHLDKPIGVAVALLGSQGAGKGVVARAFGKIFGKHFAHIAHGDQLTGRFNASVATACTVFLDEAIWAADKKAEGVLKALITEPTLQMEAKFRDPIMVQNRLRIIVASNNDWSVPAGIGDRRWFVLKVAPTYAGQGHGAYFDPLYAEINNGGAEAMLYDLLHMDLTGFDVRTIPPTAAKAHQQVLSLHGTEAWVHQILQEGAIGSECWIERDLIVGKDHAYMCYEAFSKQQRDYRPETKAVWSKKLREVLGNCVHDARLGRDRTRSFQFRPLAKCRARFATYIGAPDIEWEAPGSNQEDTAPPVQPASDAGLQIERTGLYDAARAADDSTRNPDSVEGQQEAVLRRAASQGARDLAVVRQAS